MYFSGVVREERGEEMKNILVCDDDKEIVDAIEIYLQQKQILHMDLLL